MARRSIAILYLLAAVLAMVASAAHALPGEVLSEQKISDVAGGFTGVLDDGDEFGEYLAAIGDLDHDGVIDLAVSATGDDDGGSGRGAVWILFLNSNRTVKSHQKISDTQGGFTGTLDDIDQFGTGIAVLGDLDRDGISDIAVGAAGDDDGGTNRGAVWILFLNANGTVKSHQKISDTQGGFNGVLADGDSLSHGLAMVGDLDGDENTELAVGAFGDNDGANNAGAVWILFLLPDGTVHHEQKISSTSGGFTGVLDSGDNFGTALASTGIPHDNLSVPDLVVGASGDDDGSYPTSGGINRGAIWFLDLASDGTVVSHQKQSADEGPLTGFIYDLADYDEFGRGVAFIGDIGGIAGAELAVSSRGDDSGGTNRGAFYILQSNRNGFESVEPKVSSTEGGFGGTLSDNDHFGFGLAGLGDLDGDGLADVAVGARLDDDGGVGPNAQRGAVWILSLDGVPLTCSSASVPDPGEECAPSTYDSTYPNLDFGFCSPACLIEDQLRLSGTATTAGLASITVDGVSVSTPIQSGDTVFQLKAGLIDAIANDPTLSARGVVTHSSFQNGRGDLYTTGTFGLATVTAQGMEVVVEPGAVRSEKKISNTVGGFTGVLDGDDRFGFASAGLGDLDGDGIDDYAVGAYGDDDGGFGRGAVWILFMNPDGTVKSHQKISQTSGGFGGTLTNFASFGSSIVPLGDLDRDGVVDLAVGAYLDDTEAADQGAIWILFLNADGTVKAEQRIAEGVGGFQGALDAGDGFGLGLSLVADLDLDGVAELAVGAYSDDDGGSGRGAVWILFLSRDGRVHAERKISDTAGGFDGVLDNDDRFGSRIASLYLDGDGIPDLAVSADRDDDGGNNAGAVWILFLNRDGSVKSEQKISALEGGFTGILQAGDNFGIALAAPGDVDNVGFRRELAVGAIGDDDGGIDRGAVWMLFLNTDGTVSSFRKTSDIAGRFTGGLDDSDFFGFSLSPIRGFEVDGPGGLIVGTRSDDGGTDRGAVWLLGLDGSWPTCGDGETQPGEECDRGSLNDFSGCTATCEIEDQLEIFGTADVAGSLSVLVDGVVVSVAVQIGDSPQLLAARLAAAINMDATLAARGVSAQELDRSVYTNGTLTSANVTADGVGVSLDPGTVAAEVKISNTQGGFTGTLDIQEQFGNAVAKLGDLDGDGVDDIAVGAVGDDDGGANRGAVWILFLNADGTVKSQTKISATAGGFAGTLDDGDEFGTALAALGDLDGDGLPELAVSAVGDFDGGPFRGAVWILFLNADGTVYDEAKISDTAGAFTGVLDNSDYFGSGLAALGDLDQDGVPDLAVGAWGDDDGGPNRGAIWILRLNADGSVKMHQKISSTDGSFDGPLDDNDYFGFSVAALSDPSLGPVSRLAVGAYGDDDGGPNRGAVWMLNLFDGIVQYEQKISDTDGGFNGMLDDNDFFGSSVAGIGDIDRDGQLDLAVGAARDDDGGTDRGSVWILRINQGNFGVLNVLSHQRLSDTQGRFGGVLDDSDRFGSSLAGLGDFEGNLGSTLAVGAYLDDDGAADSGAVWLLNLDTAGGAICGDDLVTTPETCDDGNTIAGDGCYSTCQVEQESAVAGTSTGGSIDLVISGVNVSLQTMSGDRADVVADQLAALINSTSELQNAGISAQMVGNRLVTNGSLDSVTILDAGLTSTDCVETSVDIGSSATSLLVSDDLSYFGVLNGSGLVVRNRESLAYAGPTYVSGLNKRGAGPVVLDNASEAFFVAAGTDIFRTNPSTGNSVWGRDVQGGCANDTFLANPVVHLRRDASAAFRAQHAHDLVYVATANGCSNTANRVYALDAQTGAIEWVFNAGETSAVDAIYGLVLDVANDRLFFTTNRRDSSSQHTVWALDTANFGNKLWSSNKGYIYADPVLFTNRLIVAEVYGTVYALDPATGADIWDLTTGGTPSAALSMASAGFSQVVVGDYFGTLWATRVGGASASWEWDTPSASNPGFVSPIATNRSRTRAFVGNDSGGLEVIDVSTGAILETVDVDIPSAKLTDIATYEVPGSLVDFLLVASDTGTVSRVCHYAPSAPSVPALGLPWQVLLAVGLALVGLFARRGIARRPIAS